MYQREPTLEELLDEPIIQQVMRSDGVRADDVRYLMQTAECRQGPAMDGEPYAPFSSYPQADLGAYTAPAT